MTAKMLEELAKILRQYENGEMIGMEVIGGPTYWANVRYWKGCCPKFIMFAWDDNAEAWCLL